MSDITKKIFSIESDSSEPGMSDIITSIDSPEPVRAPVARVTPAAGVESVPDFITRPAADVRGIVVPEENPSSGWIMWSGIALTLIWIAAASAYVYNFLDQGQASTKLHPLALTGAIMAVLLPAALITLLWISWRRMDSLKIQAQHLAIITKKLTHADETALATTQNLANGIAAELARVDDRLAQTLDRFSTMQVQLVSDTRSIDETGLILAERAENVGQNLTLQRQALESIAGTFDSKMETLSSTITRQSEALIQATGSAETNISKAHTALTASTDAAKQTGESIGGELLQAAETLTAGQSQIDTMKSQLAEMIAKLQTEQSQLQSEMDAQIKGIREVTEMSSVQSDALLGSLRSGQDTVAALNTASMTTNKLMTQQFADMGEQISAAQVQANEVGEKAAARVQESLAETRKDLSRIETNMLALQAKLRNARKDSDGIDLGLSGPTDETAKGVGRLRLKPLETDFPPVQPPQSVSLEPKPGHVDLPHRPLPSVDVAPEVPFNLGADMYLGSPDTALTNFNPDVLRRPAPESSLTGRIKSKGFGRAKPKSKSGWHWRDMLGGLEQPDGSSQDLEGAYPDGTTAEIIEDLCRFDLAPSAIVDDGTIIEASNAFSEHGYSALQNCVAARLTLPVQHLQDKLASDPTANYKFRNFLSYYSSQLSAQSGDPVLLRNAFGSPSGRAFLLAAAALQA